MRHVTIVKVGNSPDVNHLYEHIFCTALRSSFKNHGLLSYVDYHIDGKSYSKGIIHIDIFLYTATAEELGMHFFDMLGIDFNNEAMAGAQMQINAEKSSSFGGDIAKVQALLIKLHKQSWQDINQFESFDTKSVRRSFNNLWMTASPKYPTKKLYCELALGTQFAKECRELTPLFHTVSTALLRNITDELADTYYYYPNGDTFVYTNSAVIKRIGELLVPKEEIDLADTSELCCSAIKEALERQFIQKMSDFLQTSDYDFEMHAPDELEQYENTGIFVGAAGWRRVGSIDNINRVLKHTTLRLKSGHETSSIDIAKLLG